MFFKTPVAQPTSFREKQNDICLNLIFINEELMIDSLEYLPSLGASDHLVLLFNYVCYIPPDTTCPPKYNFSRVTMELCGRPLVIHLGPPRLK